MKYRMEKMSRERDELYPDKSWINRKGRPKGSTTTQKKILLWRQEHPDGRKIDCYRETGCSRSTIDRWWNSKLDQPDDNE